MTQSTDLFDDMIGDSQSENATPTTSDETPDLGADAANSVESGQTDTPVETFATVPDGCVSVTDFASRITQHLMLAKVTAGEDLDGSEYVVPQAVYQTVKAQRDRIPHVLVKGSEDKEARTYIKLDEAITWWVARQERLSTRGSGSGARGSSRTADENLALLAAAVQKHLYAQARLQMWSENVAKSEKLVEKYRGFLSEQEVGAEQIELAISEATAAFQAEMAAKDAEKAKKTKKPESDDSGE
ncbi:MAG TPA: hypothetical protein V6C65_16525 [Allocoleopsis sp.]